MSDRKKPRKNYYKNSPAKKSAKIRQRFIMSVKLIIGLSMVVCMSLMFVFSHDLLTQCGYFRANEIEVLDLKRLSKQDIITQAEVRKGDNVLSVNLSLTRLKLLSHPWIAEAEVARVLPSKLVIRIKEHTPLAVLDLGRSYLLNNKGEVFKEWAAADAMLISGELVVVKGLDYSDLSSGGKPDSLAFAAVIEALRVGADHQISGLRIKQIDVDREIGLTLNLHERGQTVKLGYDDYSIKYDRLRDVFSHLRRNNKQMNIDSIDLNRLNRVVVRPNTIEAPVNQKEV